MAIVRRDRVRIAQHLLRNSTDLGLSFGWAADNLWPSVTSLIFTPIVNEFGPSRPPLLQLAQNIGLLAGAMFWGTQVRYYK